MSIFKEIWFYTSLAGIVYAAVLGFTSYFVTELNRLQYRNNDQRRERIEWCVAAVVVVIATLGNPAEITKAVYRSIPADTDIGWLPFLLTVAIFMAFIAYACLLFAVDWLAKRLREQLHNSTLQVDAEDVAEYEAAKKEHDAKRQNPFWLYESHRRK